MEADAGALFLPPFTAPCRDPCRGSGHLGCSQLTRCWACRVRVGGRSQGAPPRGQGLPPGQDALPPLHDPLLCLYFSPVRVLKPPAARKGQSGCRRGETAVAQADGPSVTVSRWRNRAELGSRALHRPPHPKGPLHEQHTCRLKPVWGAQGTSLHQGRWHHCLGQSSKQGPTCWVQRVGTSPRITRWRFPGSADSQPGWGARCCGHTPGQGIP